MKSLLKRIANAFALVVVSPVVGLYYLLSFFCGEEAGFEGFSQCWALAPGRWGVYLRRAFYRCVLREVGEDTWIGFGVLLTSPRTSLGKRVYVGPYSVLGEVTIQDDVLIASHVSIINGPAQHGTSRVDIPIREQPGTFTPVTIGAGSWLGERAVVMANVGEHAIVGAGAVVTHPIEPFAVAVGVPARVIRRRDALDQSPHEAFASMPLANVN